MRTWKHDHMSNRFAAGLPGIKQAGGKPQAASPALREEAPTELAPAAGLGAQAPSRRGKVVISGYFDPAVRQQLAILAIKQERSQAAMIAEALNLLFERYGEAPIARG